MRKLYSRKLSRNQPILRFDVILQHDWPIEQCLLYIRVFFGGKTKRPCFDLFIHWLIKQITNTYRNHFSKSYENPSKYRSHHWRFPGVRIWSATRSKRAGKKNKEEPKPLTHPSPFFSSFISLHRPNDPKLVSLLYVFPMITGAPNDRMFPGTLEVSGDFLYAFFVNLELP